jgi:quinol-cytochrome oxidoreductase complex cytochrome b subunit
MVRRRTASPGATLGLGLATAVCLALVTLSGLLLMVYYVPAVERAHDSVQDIVSVVNLGWFARNLHRWSGHAAVALCLLHLLRTLLWGAYRGPHRRVWLLGVGLLLVTAATSFSGYLLPWDQAAYWTVTVATRLAGYLPLLGEGLMRLLLGGDEVGQAALTRFYLLHVAALPALGLALLVLHLFRLRRAGGLARPAGAAGEGERLEPAGRRLLWRELLLAAAVTLALVALSVALDARLGPAPDLLRPDNPPKAPWFLVGVQEMVGYSAFLGGVLAPALLLSLLALGPWIDGGRQSDGAPLPGARARLALAGQALLVAGTAVAGVLWWGDARQGQASWLNPASLALLAALPIPLAVWLLGRGGGRGRGRSLAYQGLASGALVLVLSMTLVGWFFRGPDWSLSAWHPGPGRPEEASPVADIQRAAGPVVELRTPAGRLDRCLSCHPFERGGRRGSRTHPAVPGHPDPARHGCSSCHGGQGRRLDHAAHQPALGGGPEPFLTRPLLEARCVRCHLPGKLAGAPALKRGLQEYLAAGCSGCHQPGRLDEGLGPDLRRLGRRSLTELRDALLRPRRGHPGSVMWSLRWRYPQRSAAGKRRLDDLLIAVLALGQDPAPYRAAWTAATVHAGADCRTCHRPPGAAAGRKHRCSYLLGNLSLDCRRCHAQGLPLAPAGRECPQVAAARPVCAVCHLR